MALEDQLEQDIKTALLGRDSKTATTLRGLKAALLNTKVALGKRESGLRDDEVIAVYSKEAKKRQESADLYIQGGNQERADAELKEKELIEKYLPAKLSSEELTAAVEEVIKSQDNVGPSDLGKIIGLVKAKVGASAEGGDIAKIVKEKLT